MSQGSAQALQEALIAAVDDPDARAAAVAALRGVEVWAATWPTDPATLRTLTNSNGITALAVFSDEAQLEEAAMRYGWLGIDGRVPHKRLHMSEAVRFAKQHHAQLVVVDIAADHALELDEGEMELVSALPSMRPPSQHGLSPVHARASSRPASVHPPSQANLDPVRTSSRPPSQASLKPTSVVSDNPEAPQVVSATFGAGSHTGVLLGLRESPAAELYDDLSDVLRDYPEVEWACVLKHTRKSGEAVPCVALRVDPTFRKHLDEITTKLREVCTKHGTPYDVVVLETPEEMKTARQTGRPFYPWRKK